VAELQWRMSTPLAVILLTMLAVPLAKSNPRQGRYSKLLVAVLSYVIYVNMLNIARVWLEHEELPSYLGLWWVHASMLLVAVTLLVAQNSTLRFRRTRLVVAT